YRPRVVDIELDNLAGQGCCGHQCHALRRLKAVPSTLRINRDHPGAESEGSGPILAEDFQSRSTVEAVDQLVTSEMGFPMAFPGKLRDAEAAVAVRSQWRSAALAIRHRRLRGPAMEHGSLREFCVEIDDAGRSGCYYFLRLHRPRVVDIELNVVAGKRRAPGRPALCRVKAVPRTPRNDGDHSGAKHKGLWRPVIANNIQGLRTVENVNQLVLGMCFPMACPCGLTGDEDTVAIRAQLRPTAPALRPLCLGCQSAEHGQLGEFRVEIDDGWGFAFHFSLCLLTVAALRWRDRTATIQLQ